MMELICSYVCKINHIEMVVFTIGSFRDPPVTLRISNASADLLALRPGDAAITFTFFSDGGQQSEVFIHS